MNNIIKIIDLNFSYQDTQILKNLNLEIKDNSFTSILGANGCGKTTLLKNILRLVPLKQNSIFVGNKDVSKINREALSQLIAYVPQNERVNYHFNIRDFISLGRYAKKTSRAEDNAVIDEMINLTNLEALSDKYVEEISGGEYQRVVIARALCQETPIILLDEPTSSLDPLHQSEVMRLLKELVAKKNMSIVCTLHSLNSALDYCNSSVLMKDGKIIYQGKSSDVINVENLKEVYSIDTTFVNNPYTNKKHLIIAP
ncbi:MAG: ABC transporter ATP-binding protein [Spirochaetaceae bacterium]|nr:ABC transporter ATP-binding protein [Spirochaetaceae bacterium]